MRRLAVGRTLQQNPDALLGIGRLHRAAQLALVQQLPQLVEVAQADHAARAWQFFQLHTTPSNETGPAAPAL